MTSVEEDLVQGSAEEQINKVQQDVEMSDEKKGLHMTIKDAEPPGE
jgi:hypothetical protein